MTAARIVIGVDGSTQAAKALADDADSGTVPGRGRARHEVSEGPGRESDPGRAARRPVPAVPLLPTGGGAHGDAGQRTVRRLSGRAVRIPAAGDPVALGAAAQAAGALTGEAPDEVARRWGTADGPLLEPLPKDTETLARSSDTLHRARLLQRTATAY